MRRRSFVWAALIGLAVLAATSGGAIGHTNTSGLLRMSIQAEPPSLDAGLATDTTSSSILLNLMDPLVRLGPSPELKPLPSAASSWTVKGSSITLHLNKQVKWWNGAPTTAQDYVYSWLRTISPELGADYAYQFFSIKGAEAYNSCDPKKTDCNTLRDQVGIKAPDKYTLQIQLTSPQPWFIQQLAHNSFLPVYKPSVDQFGNKFTEAGNFVGNGAFKLTSWKHDASLTLVKNTKWRLAKTVKVNTVEMQIIQDGTTAQNAFDAKNIDVDTTGVVPQDIPRYKKTPYFHVDPSLGTYYFGFNVKNVADVNQRRAMSFAIDRKAIVKYIAQAGQQPATGFTPIGISGGKSINANNFLPAIHQDAKAKAFMAKVKSPKKDVTLYVNNAPGHIKIATAVQAFWKNIGVNANIKVMEWKQYLQFLGPPPNSDVDTYRMGWIYDFPDAYNGLVLFTCKSGNNYTNWCNPKFDNLVAQAAKTPDFEKRVGIYRQAENILTGPNGDLPIMPIYWYTFLNLVGTNVHGFFINPTGQYDLTKVSVTS